MLMRKRAWDIARDDYIRVNRDDSLVTAMSKLFECVKSGNGCLCVLVFDGEGLVGAVSIWDTVRFMTHALKQAGLTRDMAEGDFDAMFRNACTLAGDTKVADVMDREYTILPPDYPIPSLMVSFVKKGRSYGVVKEGSKVLGVIMIQDIFEALGEEVSCGR